MSVEAQIEGMEERIAEAWELKEGLGRDPHRPAYHFMPPWAWMNDVNGALFWRGRYHIFYQHNPEGGYWKWMQWGHASSTDLVHWVHHPIALTPDLDGPDREGCFSGGAFVNKLGVPTFIYHGMPDGTCIATSEDDLLLRWTKHPANPVIPVPQPGDKGFGKYKVFDPCAWVEGDSYFALIGNKVPGTDGDVTSLFESEDLVDWRHVGPFYESDRRWTSALEDCAVPDFFQLGDKHVLVFSSHLHGTQHYVGRLEGQRFVPETHGRLSGPGGHLGGPRSLLDGSGRRILFDWVREVRGEQQGRASGWAGVMSLPWVLSLSEDGALRTEPAPELEALRMNPRVRRDVRLVPGAATPLADVSGDCLELRVAVEPGDADEVGVGVRCSPDGAERTAVSYDPTSGKLRIDFSRSSLDAGIKYYYYNNLNLEPNRRALEQLPEERRTLGGQEAPFSLAEGEVLELRIFVDRSVLEVFANGRQAMVQRVYPTRPDSLGVELFSRGGTARVRSVEAWDMAPAHD